MDAQAAMDAFAAETLEKLRDAGGAELEAVVLNASSPQIVELSARVGYPTDVRLFLAHGTTSIFVISVLVRDLPCGVHSSFEWDEVCATRATPARASRTRRNRHAPTFNPKKR